MAEGWIKLHRKITEWEWYKSPSVRCIFIHLLLTANTKDKRYKGHVIKRGQKLTSANILAEENGMCQRTVVSVLKKLQSTGEIKKERFMNGSLITILRFDLYQDIEYSTQGCAINAQPNAQPLAQPNAQPLAHNIRIKEYKNIRNNTTTKEPAKKLSLDRDGRMVADYFFRRFGGSNLSKMAATYINTALTSYSAKELMKVIDAAYNDPMVQNYNSRKSLSYILNMDRVATYLNNADK